MTVAPCHPDRPVYCSGLCHRCYQNAWAKSDLGRASARRRQQKWIAKEKASGRYLGPRVVISDRVKRQASCQLCGHAPKLGEKKLVIDHDHGVSPRTARGKLCTPCNIGLGVVETLMRNNRLNSAIEYVLSHGFEKELTA